MRVKARTEFERALHCAGCKSQEDAADRLGAGLRSIQKYIYGETYPPCSVIAAAVREYGTHAFALKHLTTACPVATIYLPRIELKDLSTSLLIMQKELHDIELIQSKMVDMACDGINDLERDYWLKTISPEINQAVGAMIMTNVVAKARAACAATQTALMG